MANKKTELVSGYAQMWPREVYDLKEGNRLLSNVRGLLDKSGVYVLQRDDHPYYVGKTACSLFERVHGHANRPYDRYYNFWNFFSAFFVRKGDIGEVEAILIAAMPTANSANPRLKRINLPNKLRWFLANRRLISTEAPSDGRKAPRGSR